jgi:hypothetical protein
LHDPQFDLVSRTMKKALLLLFGVALLAGCTAKSVRSTAVVNPDNDRPGGYQPVPAADVRFVEHNAGRYDPPDLERCIRLGAVYTDWGMGEWVYQPTWWRVKDPDLQRLLRERAGAMGANAIAWPSPAQADTTYAFAYRCEPGVT